MIDVFKKANRNVIIMSVLLVLLELLNIFALAMRANNFMNNIGLAKWLIVANIILFIIIIILATINNNKQKVKLALANFIIAIVTTVISIVILIVGGPFIGLIAILLIVLTYQAYKQLKSPIIQGV